MGYMCLFQFLFSLGICLGVGFLGHKVVLFLVFKGISIPSSIVAVSIYIPTNSARGSLFSTPSPAFILCRLFDEGHSERCEVTVVLMCISLIMNAEELMLLNCGVGKDS